jgi:membrane associated rhomboid family serine protease
MLRLKCTCGAKLKLPEDHLGQAVSCPRCDTIMRALCAGGEIDEFACRLVIDQGPERLGEQILLGGEGAIEIGKNDTRPLRLAGPLVSRAHARLIPSIDGGWTIEDERSTNGVYVNDQRITCQTLRDGDAVRIGDYLLRFKRSADVESAEQESLASVAAATIPLESETEDGLFELADVEERPPADRAGSGASATLAPPPRVIPITLPAPKCPSCQRTLPAGAKICVSCGIDIKTGRALVTSRGLDENALAVHAGIWIRFISWFIPIGLVPIASEAFGMRKPYAVWGITALTIVTSLAYLPVLHEWRHGQTSDALVLMQWSGSREKTLARFVEQRDRVRQQYRKLLSQSAGRTGTRQQADQKQLDEALDQMLAVSLPPTQARFHWYQLLTSAFLHGGILHLAGNLLFMLVFGWRVNELVGNAKMLILYPLLAIASAGTYHIMASDQPMTAYLGASGAIMGLAGMYLVLFPAQKVHMIAWFRLLLLRAWKIFRVGGFWMLLLWIAFNDVLPTLLKSNDHVAHWAHLGGFVAGALIAIVLLLTRQVTAHGTDLISRILGRHAWSLLGRPEQALPEGRGPPRPGHLETQPVPGKFSPWRRSRPKKCSPKPSSATRPVNWTRPNHSIGMSSSGDRTMRRRCIFSA